MLLLLAKSASAQTITGLSQSCATVGQAFELTINGNTFKTNGSGSPVRIRRTGFPDQDIDPKKPLSNAQIKIDIPVTALSQAGTLTIDVRQNTGSGYSNAFTITVYPTINIIGASSVCAGAQNIIYSAPSGFDSYKWSLPTGVSLVPGQSLTNREITVNFTNPTSPVTIDLSTTGCNSTKSTTLAVTVNPNYTNALAATAITVPNQLEYLKPAKFVANPANNDLNWTYEWTAIYSVGPPVKIFNDNNNDAELNLTAGEMNEKFLGVEVVQVAPTTTPCVELRSTIARTSGLIILPVELIYLKATKQDNNVVELEWATAMEKNSEGFEVQVSQDAKNYRTVAFVASKAGGNTNQKQVYTFHDKENGKYGTRYYRLTQRDMNGDAEYFGPKAVKIGEAAEGLAAFPNAFTSEVNLEVNAEEAGSMHVLVTDATGGKVLERTVKVAKGNNRELLQFNSSLPSGLYFVTTRLNGKASYLKLLKK